MKEKVLTNTELGEYAANHTRTCSADMVTNHAYGCTIVGELMSTLYDGMSYYKEYVINADGNWNAKPVSLVVLLIVLIILSWFAGNWIAKIIKWIRMNK